MDKDKAFNKVKELLAKNGIEYTVSEEGESIIAKAGMIVQWLYFAKSSIAVISSVIVGKYDVETSHINRHYEDITGFCFIKGDLWIQEKGLGFTIISLKKDN